MRMILCSKVVGEETKYLEIIHQKSLLEESTTKPAIECRQTTVNPFGKLISRYLFSCASSSRSRCALIKKKMSVVAVDVVVVSKFCHPWSRLHTLYLEVLFWLLLMMP
jgi:hypothetical protein